MNNNTEVLNGHKFFVIKSSRGRRD